MGNKFLMTLVLLTSVVSTAVYAANGSNLIGVSAGSTAMGGTGVANFITASDSLYKNPATLLDRPWGEKQFNAELSTTVFKNGASANGGSGLKDSSAGANILPNAAFTYQRNPDLAFGIGVFTYGGASTDYKNQTELTQLKAQGAFLKILPTVAYRMSDWFAIGVSPVAAIGTLATNEGTTGTQSTRSADGTMAAGAQVGVTMKPMENMTFGATYQSPLKLTYEGVIDLDAFGPNAGAPTAGLDNVIIQQPTEIAAGIGYTWNQWKWGLDYRFINWASAEGYKEMGWENQHVIAFGTQYTMGAWAFRGGFNWAQSPIRSISGEVGANVVTFSGKSVFAQSMSQLNLVAFPAISETHVTLGAGWHIGDEWILDAAFLYAPKSTVTRSGSTSGTPYSFTAEVSQWSVTTAATYLF